MTEESKKLDEVSIITTIISLVFIIIDALIIFTKILPSANGISFIFVLEIIGLIFLPFFISYCVARILLTTEKYRSLKKYGASVFVIKNFDENIKKIQKYGTAENMQSAEWKIFRKEFSSISKTRIFIYSAILIGGIIYMINYNFR